MENKKIKEIYELLKGQPQEKINAIILYELDHLNAVAQANYNLLQLFVLKSGLVEEADKICSSNFKELTNSAMKNNIKNFLDNLG